MAELPPIRMPWPRRGVHRGEPRADQPQLTCDDAMNVETFDERERQGGGKRSGLALAFDFALGVLPGPVLSMAIYRISSGLAQIDPGEQPGPGPAPEVWVGLGPGVNGAVSAINVFPVATTLVAAGAFDTAGGGAANRIAAWDGEDWSAFIDDARNGLPNALDEVSNIIRANLDGTNRLWIPQTAVGASNDSFETWDGTNFAQPGESGNQQLRAAAFGNVGGARVFTGGLFTTLGGVNANRVAAYNAVTDTFEALGDGLNNTVFTLAVFDDGAGPKLYAGGLFTASGATAALRVAVWDGASWSGVGGGIGNGQVRRIVPWDGKLYIMGTFRGLGSVDDTSPHKGITCWNPATAQYEPLSHGLRAPNQSDTEVTNAFVFDDGSGPALYVVGRFSAASNSDSGIACPGIAKWDGEEWSAPPRGFTSTPRAIRAVGDQFSSDLFVGGSYAHSDARAACGLWRFDGEKWIDWGGGGLSSRTSLAMSVAQALAHGALVNDATERFYVGMQHNSSSVIDIGFGDFQATGSKIARSDGSRWQGMGAGIAGSVNDLIIWDDGAGAKLYACGGDSFFGGSFTSPGNRIAAWDGSQWLVLGMGSANGFNNHARKMVVYDDGAGEALYVGGHFTASSDGVNDGETRNRIAGWNGSTFFSLFDGTDRGLNGIVAALAVVGSDLIIGGAFTATGDTGATALNGIAAWDGMAFSPFGSGFNDGEVRAIAVFNGDIYATGTFTGSGATTTTRIARWTGSAWASLTGSSGEGLGGPSGVAGERMLVYDDGSGAKLYVFGRFNSAGGVDAFGVAAWDGTEWSAVVEDGASIAGLADESAGTNVSRAIGGAAIIDGHIYITGGFDLVRASGGGPAFIARGEMAT